MSDASLKSYYQRWLNREEAKQAVADDLKELFAEMKGEGHDTKAARAAFRRVAAFEVAEKKEEIEGHEALVETYFNALTRDAREGGAE
ncbi:GapR family DNA-binding domain-containing protein [Brucella sp. TWI432]